MRLAALQPEPVEELIHGVLVRDSFQWLEQRDLPETGEWIRTQQQMCDDYFRECPQFETIRSIVRQHLDVETLDQPGSAGPFQFFRKRRIHEEQGSIYVRDVRHGAASDRCIVPADAKNPFISVSVRSISAGGHRLAYEQRVGGEDYKAIHIVDTLTGRELADPLARGSIRGFHFLPDETGFYYCHEIPGSRGDHTIRLHKFGQPHTDRVIFQTSRSSGSRLILIADETHIGAILLRPVDGAMVEDFWIADHGSPDEWIRVLSERPMPFNPVLASGRMFAITEDRSTGRKIVEFDHGGQELRTVVPNTHGSIRDVAFGSDAIYVLSSDGLDFAISIWSLNGEKRGRVATPTGGTVRLLPVFGDRGSLFFSHESVACPPTLYEYSSRTGEVRRWHEISDMPNLPVCTTREEAIPRIADGTELSISLVLGETSVTPGPLLMTTYGGFGIPTTSQFSVFVSIMLKLGAILATPHVRGGDDAGRASHELARGRNKQRTFDDFLLAADWLCRQRFTTPEQFALFGGSNAGLLVGVAITQRPDLFRAALCIAPLLDMVRYERFDDAARWMTEYGSVKNKNDFLALHAYSPYHNISNHENYPATLLVSGDSDTRCNPAHVRKMTARLQNRDAQRRVIILDYSSERGHVPALPLSTRIDALARRLTFLCRELQISHFGQEDTQ